MKTVTPGAILPVPNEKVLLNVKVKAKVKAIESENKQTNKVTYFANQRSIDVLQKAGRQAQLRQGCQT